MTFDGAVIREQGVTFGVMAVKAAVLNDPSRRDAIVAQASIAFGGIPVVLMGQAPNGRARYYGRVDLVRFMANVPFSAVPWKRYRLAA